MKALYNHSNSYSGDWFEKLPYYEQILERYKGVPLETSSNTDGKKYRHTFEEVIDDIVIGWCHIHGFAHLKLEQQFNMVPGKTHKRLMQRSAARLSTMLQTNAT